MAEKQLKRPPKNAKELQPFLDSAGGGSDLQSPSGDPLYEIIWGVALPQSKFGDGKKSGPKEAPAFDPGAGSAPPWPILAYEKSHGSNTRLVLFTSGPVMELTQQDFQKATFANNHKPR